MRKYDANVPSDWKSGVVEELMWWWLWIQKKREEGTLKGWANLRDAAFPFEKYVHNFDANTALTCLNIGCGPRSNMGERSAHQKLHITHMDPLAEAYNAIMDFLDAPGGGDVQFGAVEIIDQLDVGTFNFISAKNCLDHAYDVPDGLRKLIGLLDTQGVVILEHYENEAEAQNYLGFHKWNIEIVDEMVRIWSQNTSEIFNHKEFGLELEYTKTMTTKGSGVKHPTISIAFTKNLEVGQQTADVRDVA